MVLSVGSATETVSSFSSAIVSMLIHPKSSSRSSNSIWKWWKRCSKVNDFIDHLEKVDIMKQNAIEFKDTHWIWYTSPTASNELILVSLFRNENYSLESCRFEFLSYPPRLTFLAKEISRPNYEASMNKLRFENFDPQRSFDLSLNFSYFWSQS